MSDLFKFAYVRGAQNALVKAGALSEYPTVEAADLAVKLAATRITTDPTAGAVNNEQMSNAMADLVSYGAKTANEIAAVAPEINPGAAAALASSVPDALEDAAQSQAEAAAQMLEVADRMEGDGMTSLAAARRNVARLKAASESGAVGAAGAALGGQGQKDEEEDRPGPYANKKPETDHKAPFTGESVNLDAKTAAAILRKLAEGGALGAEGADLGGKGQKDEEEDPRGPGYANKKPDTDHKAPFTPGMEDVSEGMVSTASAYNVLLRKTASEVGHHLPNALTDAEKFAALRTMMGMNSAEQVDYLNRLNHAVTMKTAMENAEEDESEGEGPKEEEAPESAEKDAPEGSKEEKEEEEELAFLAAKEDSEEKSAAILRRLGLGR